MQYYANVSNPGNCLTTYTLSYSPSNSSYTEYDLSINKSTGILSSTTNNIFKSKQLQITVTATFKAFNCSDTKTTVGFTVE